MKIDGACHCGQLRYEADVDPDKVIVCHCTDCQVLSGSAFRSVVVSSAADFKLLAGTPKTYIKAADSGARRAQVFCPECGSHIYATSADDDSNDYGIRLGTVNQRDSLKPIKQIWCQSAQDWVNRLDSLQKVEKQ